MSLGAGAPRSGDATGRDCRRPPTAPKLAPRLRNGGGGMSLGAGAPRSGDATRANAAGRRQRDLCAESFVRKAVRVILGAEAVQ